MEMGAVRSPGAGVTPQGQRDHNERLVLSLLLRHGALPGSDLSRLAGLSAQTVSVILRRLEARACSAGARRSAAGSASRACR
jgi:uncharacterized membrane protein